MKDFSKTNKRWVISLNEIKEYFNNNNTKISVNAFIDRRLHCTWRTFLLNTKVIFKNEYGYYKWKENIPVTKKLIDKYRDADIANITTFDLQKNKFNIVREKQQIADLITAYNANPNESNQLKTLAKLNGFKDKNGNPDINGFLKEYQKVIQARQKE